jgi:hypothetical protein
VAARVRVSGPAGGPRRAEAAGRLDDVAAAVDGGGGATEAQALVSDVESWQAGGELAAPWVGQVLGVLAQVPGVTLAPPTTPPSTDLVVPPDENGRAHGNGNGNGNGDHGGGGD